jgi:hypothetical protein
VQFTSSGPTLTIGTTSGISLGAVTGASGPASDASGTGNSNSSGASGS